MRVLCSLILCLIKHKLCDVKNDLHSYTTVTPRCNYYSIILNILVQCIFVELQKIKSHLFHDISPTSAPIDPTLSTKMTASLDRADGFLFKIDIRLGSLIENKSFNLPWSGIL